MRRPAVHRSFIIGAIAYCSVISFTMAPAEGDPTADQMQSLAQMQADMLANPSTSPTPSPRPTIIDLMAPPPRPPFFQPGFANIGNSVVFVYNFLCSQFDALNEMSKALGHWWSGVNQTQPDAGNNPMTDGADADILDTQSAQPTPNDLTTVQSVLDENPQNSDQAFTPQPSSTPVNSQ